MTTDYGADWESIKETFRELKNIHPAGWDIACCSMGKILSDEVLKEINREVFKTITKNAHKP